MKYIIIENYQSDWPSILTSSMTSNMPMIFTSLAEAETNLHTDAIVVPLSKNLMNWEVDDSMPDDWDDETKWPPKSDSTVYL